MKLNRSYFLLPKLVRVAGLDRLPRATFATLTKPPVEATLARQFTLRLGTANYIGYSGLVRKSVRIRLKGVSPPPYL